MAVNSSGTHRPDKRKHRPSDHPYNAYSSHFGDEIACPGRINFGLILRMQEINQPVA